MIKQEHKWILVPILVSIIFGFWGGKNSVKAQVCSGSYYCLRYYDFTGTCGPEVDFHNCSGSDEASCLFADCEFCAMGGYT